MKEIETVEEFESFYNSHNKIYILKHSTRCPISFAAFSRVKEFSDEHNIDVVIVKVVENRALSNHIEQTTGVRHESPQIFIVKEGDVLATTSHSSISKPFLLDYLEV